MTFAHEKIKPFFDLNETKAIINLIQNPIKGASINEITVIDFSLDGSQVYLKTPENVFEVDFSGEEKPADMILQDIYEHLYTIDSEDLEFDENGLISFAELDEYYYLDQEWEDNGVDQFSSIVWEETTVKSRETKLGGAPDFAEGTEIEWPHLNIGGQLAPMLYAGQVQLIHGRFVYIFIGAVLDGKLVNTFPFGYIEGESNYENVDMAPVNPDRIPILSPVAIRPANGHPLAPAWINGKQIPDHARSFVFQIPFGPTLTSAPNVIVNTIEETVEPVENKEVLEDEETVENVDAVENEELSDNDSNVDADKTVESDDEKADVSEERETKEESKTTEHRFTSSQIRIGFGEPDSAYYVFWDREDRVQIVHQQG